MDVGEKLKQMAVKNVENEKRSKVITHLTTRKFDLQKSLRNIESTLEIKRCELDKIKKEVISLSCELPLWEEKMKESKTYLENLVKAVVEQDGKNFKIQTDLWTNLNEWVTTSPRGFGKNISLENLTNKCAEIEEKTKEEKMEQIKLEGQLQAVRAYEKYQRRKINEIQRIKDVVDNVNKLSDSI